MVRGANDFFAGAEDGNDLESGTEETALTVSVV
jgi:hypothetical protein